MIDINVGDKFFMARILPNLNTFDVLEMKVRGVYDNYFVCLEKRDKQAFLFHIKDIDNILFKNRIDALRVIQIAEDGCKKRILTTETHYEEH